MLSRSSLPLSRALAAAGATALLALFALGCDCGSPTPRRCSTSGDCPGGRTCLDGTCVAGVDAAGTDGGGLDGTSSFDGRVPVPVSIAITPASPTLTSVDGARPTVDLDVVATYDDGSTRPITTAFWTADAPVLGDVDRDTGLYTASGAIAGTTTVEVDALSMTATTTVTVRVERTWLGPDVPADAPSRFSGAGTTDPAAEAALLYPLEGTVFPQNVRPADLQWRTDRGAAGDLFRVRVETTGVRVEAYVAHTGPGFGFHYLPDEPTWRAIAESAPEAPVTIAVDRWVAATGTHVAGTPRTVRFADATIRGAIYYWDLGGGRIVRIAGDGSGLEAFMPSPPARPGDGRRCVACHAVSHDGTRMAAELWDGGDFGAIFDLTLDLTGDPAPTVVAPNVVRFLTATFSPDNRRLVANNGNELFLVDGATGARLTAGGAGLPAAGAANPAWSPDGAHVAFVSNTNGGWAVDYTRGDLSIIDVDPATPDAFGMPRLLLSGGSLVVARPSWSPTSGWIAFQHGEHSRAFQDFGGGVHARRNATIRMVSRDGSLVFDLAALNAGTTNSYYPTFSPFDEGGYFWLAFFSTREYGNSVVGTGGTERRQLWVAAIDSTPTGGLDPSNAPYWLPQQNVAGENMAAFWAPEPCRAEGRTCATSGECCSGFCRDTGSGPMCVPPDVVECSHEGEACRTDADCCAGEGATCIANVCSTIG